MRVESTHSDKINVRVYSDHSEPSQLACVLKLCAVSTLLDKEIIHLTTTTSLTGVDSHFKYVS